MPVSNFPKSETPIPGQVVLLGSGETSSNGRKVFDQLLRNLHEQPLVALLETPAGFEPNSALVIERVAEFLRRRLRNYSPQVEVIQARRRETTFSPDDPKIAERLLDADLIFMGPGSPTYAVRQLAESVTWHYLQARFRLGTPVVFASAAVIAISAFALPVYEIYKVGEDLHWNPGLDFFGVLGLPVVFVPHWNNRDGGDELDTSRCFMGQERFAHLLQLLPSGLTVVGIDENTALTVDLHRGTCEVMGLGSVTVIHTGSDLDPDNKTYPLIFKNGECFFIQEYFVQAERSADNDLPPEIWTTALEAQRRQAKERVQEANKLQEAAPAEVQRLTFEREAARQRKDWAQSDALRVEIETLGWVIQDTPEGPILALSKSAESD